MRLFNEIVTNRKSRSLFSGAKRWFGQVKVIQTFYRYILYVRNIFMTCKSVVRGSDCSLQIAFQAKPGTASGTSVIYGKEAPELQIRRLGDLFFMLKLYKQAYNCYHTAKKDFQVRSIILISVEASILSWAYV